MVVCKRRRRNAEAADSVDFVDVAAHPQVGLVKLGKRPSGIGFSPDGKTAYVAAELAGTVHVIAVTTKKVTGEMKAGIFSDGVAVAPDRRRVLSLTARLARFLQ